MSGHAINSVKPTISNEIDVIMDCSSDAVFVLALESFKILKSNNNAALLLGLFREALSEHSILEFIDSKSNTDWYSHIDSTLQGQFDNFSGRIKTSDSKALIVEAKTRLILWKNQKVLICIVKEITGFPNQINKFKKEIAFYKTILNEMPTQFAVLSPEWRYMFINKPSIGDDEFREWMIGKSDYDFCEYRNKDTELARIRQENYQAVADSKKVKEWIEEMTTKDGETIYILRKLYPYFLKDKLHLTFGFGINITELVKGEKERKKIMEIMSQKNEALQQFAYIVTHDLKEPLRGITSFSNLLEKRYTDKLDGDALDFLNFIVTGTKRMNDLLNELTSYISIKSNADAIEMMSLEKAVAIAESNMQILIEETNAEITIDSLPDIKCHRVYINQLFQNLINNAIKFRKETPKIHISAKMEGGFCIVEVKDNGIGIQDEHKDRIFQVYNRLNKIDYEGTGIGLAICKKIVQLHSGKIWIESDGKTGSSFFFSLKII